MIYVKSIGEAWIESVKHILQQGQPFFDEDVGLLEVLGLNITITSPTPEDGIITLYGDDYVLQNMIKKFEKGVIMPNRPFTYGSRIYDYDGIDQFEWLVERLSNKPESKSATISLQKPGSCHPNQPCLTTIDVKIRDNSLQMQVFFRSQNILGRQYANLAALAKLQKKISRHLNVDIGQLRCYIASAHIYNYEKKAAESLINKSKNFKLKDKFYSDGPKSIRESFSK